MSNNNINISNFDLYTNTNGEEYSCNFVLNNTPISICNSLRRVILSNIPNASFCDNTNSDGIRDSIIIKENESVLHNELLAQRIGLIPITTYKNDSLKIKTTWNDELAHREYSFINNPPIFNLNIINDKQTRIAKNIDHDILTVKSNDFTVQGDYDVSEFFISDYFTDDYVIINKIKSEQIANKSEKIVVECIPKCGIGKEHTRYTSVGTVSYEFITDTSKIDNTWEVYLSHIEKERVNKGLSEPLTSDEIQGIKRTFYTIDKDRVYLKNKFDEANSVSLKIEGNGSKIPHEIMSDSLKMLSIMLDDILRCFKINSDLTIKFNENKMYVTQNEVNEFTVTIKNENHTLGNLISDITKQQFLIDSELFESKLLNFASYKMPHPLNEEIEIKYIINTDSEYKNFVDECLEKYLGYKANIDDIDVNELNKLCVMFILVKCINKINQILDIINTKYNELLKEKGINSNITFEYEESLDLITVKGI